MKNAICIVMIVVCAISANAQTIVNGSFVHKGLVRSYSYYVPAVYNSAKPVPLILNLHGYTSDGLQQALNTNFMSIADTAGFIVAHPDGSKDGLGNRFWNYKIFGVTVDDVGFLEALIDTISLKYKIDPNRVYAAGMSNGGYMSYYLACASDRFAAIASVTGSMPAILYSCDQDYVTPVMEMHGTKDQTVPYNGNLTSKGIEDVVNYWVEKNKCNPTPVQTELPDINKTDNATATHFLYSGGKDGHTVEFYRINNGGHTWPGSSVNPPFAGNTCRDFNASKEIWRFFSQYDKSVPNAVSNTGDEMRFSFYPNPARDVLFMKNAERLEAELCILDVEGRIIKVISLHDTPDRIDVSSLESGLYFIKSKSQGRVIIDKLFVLK